MATKNPSTPEAQFNSEMFRDINPRDINALKEKVIASPRNRYRLCLHADQSHHTQEMIICLKGFQYFQPHLHPEGRSESYHMIEGKMDIYLMDERGEVVETIELVAPHNLAKDSCQSFMYRLSAPMYHFTFPRSEWTVYHEVLTGPWSKELVVNYAPFAPGEDDWEGVKEYVRKIAGYAFVDGQ